MPKFQFQCECGIVDGDDEYKALALRRDAHLNKHYQALEREFRTLDGHPHAFIKCEGEAPHLFSATCPRCAWVYCHLDANAVDFVRQRHATGHWAEDDVAGVTGNTRYPALNYREPLPDCRGAEAVKAKTYNLEAVEVAPAAASTIAPAYGSTIFGEDL